MTWFDIKEHSEEWHLMRSRHIGGSESASLFGEEEKPDAYAEDVTAGFSDSLFSLHYIKAGIVAPRKIEAERIDWGTRLEPKIAEGAAEERGWFISKGQYATDDTTPGMGASLDYIIMNAGVDQGGVTTGGSVVRGITGPLKGPGVLQIKNVDAMQFARKWQGDEAPLYILLQVQHEMACSGYRWGVLAALVGGNSLKLYFYEARAQIISQIRQKVTEFWKRIADGKPPAADGSDASAHALRELVPVMRNTEHAPLDLTGDNELPGICMDLQRATKERLALEKQEAGFKAQIAQKMGDATYARCGSWVIKCGVTPANPGRAPRTGEIIGAKREIRKYSVKEV